MNPPKVFISYAHSSPTHKREVENLSAVLQAKGLHVILDSQVLTPQGPEEGWPRWMKRQLNDADWVLMFFDHTYRRRYDGDEQPGRGLGATWEGAIITHRHYRESTINKKFIPLLADDASSEVIPDEFFGYTRYHIPRQADELAAILFKSLQLKSGCSKAFGELTSSGNQPVNLPSRKTFATTRLPDTSQLSFVGRTRELALIDSAWASSEPEKTNIICFVGQGGEGKTSLIVRWLAQHHYGQQIGANRYFDWSFYSQGTTDQLMASSDPFFDAALRWFGEISPERLTGWVKGARLAELIRETRTLLILDGLEPLQHPPGPFSGQLRDDAMKALLVGLAQQNRGLCLLSSRAPIADISHFQRTTVITRDLHQLSRDDGVALLRNLEVRGPDDELRKAVEAFEGHALALSLLGNYLRSETEDHDIRRWCEVPLLEEDDEEGGHARRVLKAYELWLGPSSHTVAILRLLGLFGRPAETKCLDVLRQKPAIPGLTDTIVGLPKAKWIRAINHLVGLRLVARAGDALDAHALTREYFAREMKNQMPDAWREAQSRLYDFIKDDVPQYPATLDQMRPLYHAIAHGCAATKYVACLKVFYERICRTGGGLRGQETGSIFHGLGSYLRIL